MTRRLTATAAVVAAAIVLVGLASLCFSSTADDAFVSFRYARNFAAGNGLVFNVGERVEGYSNLTWVLIVSCLEFLGLNAVLWAKVIGVCCAVLTLAVAGEIGRKHLDLPGGYVLAGLLYLATSVGVVYYSISGLETALFTLLIALLVYLILERKLPAAGVVCAALVLTRPEGVLFVLPLVVALVTGWRRRGAAVLSLIWPVAAVIALTVWRLWYYGRPLPNTFYSKVDTAVPLWRFLLLHTKALASYTFSGFRGSEAVLVLAAFGAVVAKGRRHLPLVASVLAMAVFVWVSAGDWMSFARFYVPVLPMVALLWLAGVDSWRRGAAYGRARVAGASVLILVPLFLSLAHSAACFSLLDRNRDVNPAMHCRAHVEVARYLTAACDPCDVVVVNEPGAIGYYTGLTIVDMSGKTDATSARLEAEGRLDEYAEYILSREPRYVLLNDKQWPWDRELHPLHRVVLDRLVESGLYEKDRVFELNYYKNLILYTRTGTEAGAVRLTVRP